MKEMPNAMIIGLAPVLLIDCPVNVVNKKIHKGHYEHLKRIAADVERTSYMFTRSVLLSRTGWNAWGTSSLNRGFRQISVRLAHTCGCEEVEAQLPSDEFKKDATSLPVLAVTDIDKTVISSAVLMQERMPIACMSQMLIERTQNKSV
ncbi:hypothetical protein CR513_39427, partial [Mucuna pruriens]